MFGRERKQYQKQIEKLTKELSRSKSHLWLKIGLIAVLVVVVCGTIIFIVKKVEKSKPEIPTVSEVVDSVENFVDEEVIGSEGELTTVVATPSLSELIAIEQLRTLSYDYNSICVIGTSQGPVYYIHYNGNAVLGVDMNRVEYRVDEFTHEITVVLPDVDIIRTSVDPASIEYIFIDSAYDNPDTGAAAQRLCEGDLQNKINADESLMALARETTSNEVEAMIAPLIAEFYPEYTLVVTYGTTVAGEGA